MKRFALTYGETASIIISVIAIAISAWAVEEAKSAALQSRRAEVRGAAISTIDSARATYSNALCVIRVAGIKAIE